MRQLSNSSNSNFAKPLRVKWLNAWRGYNSAPWRREIEEYIVCDTQDMWIFVGEPDMVY